MSYALGQPVLLTALVRNAAGALANADTVVLTITRPDGTTETPTVTNPPTVTGTYTFTYTPTQEHLHTVRWVFGGTNASAPILDSFYVEPAAVAPLISLAQARKQCRLASPSDDTEVQRFALIASDICERRTQVWRRTLITATFDGGRHFLRLRRPVLSITTVIESGVAVDSTGWVLDAGKGWLYRGTTVLGMCWAIGRQNVVVTYQAGTVEVPWGIRQGVRLLVAHLWDSQRGGSGLPASEGADFEIDPRTGFTVPNAVLELWKPFMPPLVA
jgi:hypothetical protein